ncbi:MAG: hypothetical protein RSD28_03995 [Lachnospiraceae bacterium]
MKLILNEYGGVVLGIAAALGITGTVARMMQEQGVWYEAIRIFIEGIC